MTNEEVNIKIEKLKDDVSKVMTGLVDIQKESKLPVANDSFIRAQKLLKQQEYSIVVCGEVKQGKSSFINSLLGKPLLPVADQVTTSQVFRISNSPEESFYLVFDDGTRTKLDNYDQMIRYGTELTPEERDNDPLLVGRTLQWIEVNTPASFLPPNVHLLDTPGLGALYRSHAEITHRYAAAADAVIFLKTAQDPLVDTEIAFLKEVLTVTPNIMFIQSKIDQFDANTLEEMIARNQEQLNERLGLRTEDTQYKFWPFSSKSLLKASQTTDDKARTLLQKASHYDDITGALSVLLYRTLGHCVCSLALDESAAFFRRQINAVQEECNMLTAKTAQDKARIQNNKKKRQDEFNRKWGKNGTEYANLAKRISTIIATGKNRVSSIFSNRGSVFIEFNNRIDDLSTNDEISECADSLADSFTAAVSAAWQSEISSVQHEINSDLVDCKIGCDQVSYNTIAVQTTAGPIVSARVYDNIRNFSIGGSIGGSIGAVVGLVLAPLTGGLSTAINVLGPLIGFLWGGNAARKQAMEQQNQKNKTVLKNMLNNYLSQLHSQFMVSPRVGENSPADQFFTDVKEGSEKGLQDIISNETSALQTECARLDDDARCSEEEATKRLAEKRKILENLVKLGETINQVNSEKNNLSQSIIG